jgi:F0F1-type ATP synthase assembly protein I
MLVSASPITVARRQVVRAIVWQAATTGVLAMASALGFSGRAGLAVLVGGGIAMLGTAYLALALSRQRLGGAPGGLIWDVFLSWAIKLVLVLSLLTIAFRSKQLPPSFLMAGLCGALLAYWFAMSMAGPIRRESNRGSDRDGS